jgi:A/G-specific adenine glycosylase
MFTNKLVNWYLLNRRDLPWRNTKNPYKIWLSEIMLQQTRVEQGLPYYLKFVAEFPRVFDLANASEEKVLKLWQGLGYYSRARNLHATAKYVAHDLSGEFPDTHAELIKLKGVGDYTASAIASFCFDEIQPVVDGNVYRVLSRYIGIEMPINESRSLKAFKATAFELIDRTNPGQFNQAIMEYGATECTPKKPNCTSCTFNDSCYALKHNKVSELPIKLKKAKVKQRYFNYLVLVSDDQHTILEKRPSTGIWANLYQFPLIETDTTVGLQDLENEIMTTYGSPKDMVLFNEKPIIHKLSHQHLHTNFWIIMVTDISGEKTPMSEVYKRPVPILIHNFIEAFKF